MSSLKQSTAQTHASRSTPVVQPVVHLSRCPAYLFLTSYLPSILILSTNWNIFFPLPLFSSIIPSTVFLISRVCRSQFVFIFHIVSSIAISSPVLLNYHYTHFSTYLSSSLQFSSKSIIQELPSFFHPFPICLSFCSVQCHI